MRTLPRALPQSSGAHRPLERYTEPGFLVLVLLLTIAGVAFIAVTIAMVLMLSLTWFASLMVRGVVWIVTPRRRAHH